MSVFHTRLIGAVGVAVLATGVAAGPAAAAPAPGPVAPLLAAEKGTPTGKYLVVLKPGAGSSADAAETARKAGGRSVHRYSRVLNGFSADLPGKALDAVRADPAVAYVREDARVKAIETAPRAGGSIGATQTSPPSWGLDRIDQRNLPLSNSYTYDTTGTGVTVFVVDTGVRPTHVDFGGRAQSVYTSVDDGNSADDCQGHGTHVAGTIAGSSYGVAKGAQIRGVRVLGCDGYGSNVDLIEGIDWVAANHPARSIANFSLQNFGTEVNEAAERLIDSGVIPVFIGGNFNTDACGNAPRSSRGITVGAVTKTDARWADSSSSGSNYGSCIDLFAPGVDITSAGYSSDTAVAAGWQGTSMAAPHVVGWLARYLQTNPSATLAQAKTALLGAATTGVLTNVGSGSPNRLLYAAPGTTSSDTTAPSTPGTPASSSVTATTASVSWSASTDNVGVSGYQVELAVGAGSFTAAGTSATTSYGLTGLTGGTTYRVRVRAFDAAGNLSGYSSAGSFTTSPATTSVCKVAYTASGGGTTYTANLTITNTGSTTINGWTLAFTLPSGQTLAQPGWSATYTVSGQNVTATPASWNSVLAPNQSTTIGFNGSGSTTARPSAYTLNGTACTVA